MPLSKKRMRERKGLDRGVKPKSNPNPNKVVKPSQAKISELREMIKDVSLGGFPVDSVGSDWADIEVEDWPEIDADGHPIPDF